jgi:asparaginyl-tRNA synthetase
MVTSVVKRVRVNCADELEALSRELKNPKPPFKKVTHHDAIALLTKKGFELNQGEEIPWHAESALSKSFGDFFWIIDYPKSARGFYDREDEDRPGILRDFDLFYPEGYGEAISGGEREYKYDKVAGRMISTGEVPEAYKWYLQMLKEGTTPSAGFGIGVERLTRYICGKEFIWDSVPFPKVPGIVSP